MLHTHFKTFSYMLQRDLIVNANYFRARSVEDADITDTNIWVFAFLLALKPQYHFLPMASHHIIVPI